MMGSAKGAVLLLLASCMLPDVHLQPRPQGFCLKKWVGREKALALAGHVHSLNIPEKLIYMQPLVLH